MDKFVTGKQSYCRGNVMTPINWFGAVFETVLIPTAACQFDNWLGVGCFVLACLCFLFYSIIFACFAIKNPDRLQSEQFNLEQQALALGSGSLSLQSGEQAIAIAADSHQKDKTH